MDVPEHTRQIAEEFGIDAAELHRRVQEGLARFEAGVAEDAKKYRWHRRWRRLVNLPSDCIWQVRGWRLRRRRETTLYVSRGGGRGEALLARLRGVGYHLHDEGRRYSFHSYRRFGAEVDACDALLFIGEEAHASAHRSLMSLYIASGRTVALGASDKPLADRPRKRPVFVLELWDQAPRRYAEFMRAHPEIVLLDQRDSRALAQVTEVLSAAK